MRRSIQRRVVGGGAVAVLAASGFAQAAQPVRALVWRCEPALEIDVPTGAGFGETSAKRGTKLWFAYATQSTQDDADKPGVATATSRVEVCWAKQGVFTCPGDGCNDAGTNEPCKWVVYRKPTGQQAGIGQPPDSAGYPIANFGAKPFAPKDGFPIGPPPGTLLDWDDEANAGKFLYVRVNGESLAFALPLGGWCPIAQRLPTPASNFAFFGTRPDVPSFDSTLFPDPCNGGNKAGLPDPTKPQSACVADAVDEPNFLRDRLVEIDDWQTSVAMAYVAGGIPSPGPSACDTPECDCGGAGESSCPVPTRIRLFSDDGGFHSGLGHIELGTSAILPSGSNPALSPPAWSLVRVLGHEYWHSLEGAWLIRKNAKEAGLFASAPFHEGSASAVDTNICLFGYPGLDPAQCASPGKLGVRYGIFSISPNYFDAPDQSSFWQEAYVGGIFLRYAVEQFAVPPGTNAAHPACPTCIGSQVPTTYDPNTQIVEPLDARYSDEGLDLMGLLLDSLDECPGVLQLLCSNQGCGCHDGERKRI